MEQFDKILVLIKNSFQNGVPRYAVWLINNMVESVGRVNHTADTLDLITGVKNIHINTFTHTLAFSKCYTFLYHNGVVVNVIYQFVNNEQIVSIVFINKLYIDVWIKIGSWMWVWLTSHFFYNKELFIWKILVWKGDKCYSKTWPKEHNLEIWHTQWFE